MAKAKRKFVYKAPTTESVTRQMNKGSNIADPYIRTDVPLWKPSEGENRIRILPPSWEEAETFGMEIWVHYGVGPENAAYLDLLRMRNQPDPISEEVRNARIEGDDELRRQLDSSRRFLVYIIDRNDADKGIQAWAMPYTNVARKIMDQMLDPDTKDALPIDSPDEGYDVIVKREGEGLKTKYEVKIARNPSKIANFDEDCAEFLMDNPLPKILVFYSYDHIKAVFEGRRVPGSKTNIVNDDEEDEEVVVQRPRKSAKQSKVVEEEEVEEEVEEAIDDAEDAPFENEDEEATDDESTEVSLTWEELEKADGDELFEIAEQFSVDHEGDEDEDTMRKMIADDLGITIPEKKSSSNAERLRKLRSRK